MPCLPFSFHVCKPFIFPISLLGFSIECGLSPWQLHFITWRIRTLKKSCEKLCKEMTSQANLAVLLYTSSLAELKVGCGHPRGWKSCRACKGQGWLEASLTAKGSLFPAPWLAWGGNMNKLKNYEYPSFVIVVHSCRLMEKICFMTKWKKTDPASGRGKASLLVLVTEKPYLSRSCSESLSPNVPRK